MWRIIHQVKSGYYMIREVIQNVENCIDKSSAILMRKN